VKADLFGGWLIEEEGGRRLDDVFSQFLPRVGLREDVLRQALRAVAAVGFLNRLKNQFGHIVNDTRLGVQFASGKVAGARENV
jgi:hypothetical protein